MKANQATAEVFFDAFKALKGKDKEAFLEKIISDPELREDLIDVVLIEKAKRVNMTRPVSAANFRCSSSLTDRRPPSWVVNTSTPRRRSP